MANEKQFYCGSSNDMGVSSNIYVTGSFSFGYSSAAGTTRKGAIRFLNVAIPQGTSVESAQLMIRVQDATPDNNANVAAKVWGIDEDNTSNFSSNPFGRSKTTAYNTHTFSDPRDGDYKEFGVGNIVNEIVGRGGWSSGNAMGFIVEDNGTATDESRFIYDGYSNNHFTDSYLAIRISAEPDFALGGTELSAPTFPDTQNWGIRISRSGVNVLDATEDQLFFTTRKKEFKVLSEAEVETTSNPHLVAHGLSYAPAALVYAEDSNKRVKLNRTFDPNYIDPLGGVEGLFGADSSNLGIFTPISTTIYYYIFIDELE